MLLAALAGAVAEPGAGAATPARSDEGSDDRLRLIRERRRSLEDEVARLRLQERSLLGEVERLELEVQLRGEQLREVRAVLQETNREMDATLARLEELEGSIGAARPVLAARARALYKLGELSYLRMLLSVESPSDFFRGYRFVNALARRDNERFSAFKRARDQVTATRIVLEQRTQQALELRAEVARARRLLDADRTRKTGLLTEIVEKKEIRAAYLAELEDAERRLEQLIAGLAEGEVEIPIAALQGSLPWPVDGRVRSGFGRRKHPRFDTYTVQNGIEIEAEPGTPVGAVHEGTVVFAERFRGYGLMVVVDHGGRHHSLYAHLERCDVEVGDRLRAGQVVGTVGSTALEGPGLYLELRFQGRAEDPQAWLAPSGS